MNSQMFTNHDYTRDWFGKLVGTRVSLVGSKEIEELRDKIVQKQREIWWKKAFEGLTRRFEELTTRTAEENQQLPEFVAQVGTDIECVENVVKNLIGSNQSDPDVTLTELEDELNDLKSRQNEGTKKLDEIEEKKHKIIEKVTQAVVLLLTKKGETLDGHCSVMRNHYVLEGFVCEKSGGHKGSITYESPVVTKERMAKMSGVTPYEEQMRKFCDDTQAELFENLKAQQLIDQEVVQGSVSKEYCDTVDKASGRLADYLLSGQPLPVEVDLEQVTLLCKRVVMARQIMINVDGSDPSIEHEGIVASCGALLVILAMNYKKVDSCPCFDLSKPPRHPIHFKGQAGSQ